MIPITWPVESPFVSDIYLLLDRLVAVEKAKKEGAVKETKVVEEPPVKETKVVEEPKLKVVEKKKRKKS